MDEIVLLGVAVMGYYFLTRSSVVSPALPVSVSYPPPGPSPTNPNVPVVPPYSGTGTVTDPSLIPAQSSINQQIAQFNNDVNAGVSVAEAAVGILATLSTSFAAIAGPIGAAIAAIAILVRSFVSDVHLYANALVNQYENPFGQGVISIIQQITAELNAGTLTLSDAQTARDGILGAWVLYQAKMHEIQTQGTDWYIVATQSLNNLDNQYLGQTLPNGKTLGAGMSGAYGNQPNYGFMSTWLDWLNQRVTSLGGV